LKNILAFFVFPMNYERGRKEMRARNEVVQANLGDCYLHENKFIKLRSFVNL